MSATLHVQAAVQQMLNYLTDNSYIKVFSLEVPEGDDNEETETLRNRAHARQLGYWMFFNLRQTSVGVGLAEGDVRYAAQRVRLSGDKAWALLSGGGTTTATMEEVVSAMESVYGQRKRLSRALANNQTVVREVETALGVVLLIVWVFIAAAIFDPGTVQVTWTALSAVFLSMSFIFGNAIRQVCCCVRAVCGGTLQRRIVPVAAETPHPAWCSWSSSAGWVQQDLECCWLSFVPLSISLRQHAVGR